MKTVTVTVPCLPRDVLEKREGNLKIRVEVIGVHIYDGDVLQPTVSVCDENCWIDGRCEPIYNREKLPYTEVKGKYPDICNKCKYGGETCTLFESIPDEINFSDIGRGKPWKVVKSKN